MSITAIIVAASIPSAITGFCFWYIEHRIQTREKEQERREQERLELMTNIMKSVNATMGLSEKTAEAVSRIPDSHCNGDMHAALDYAKQVKHEQREFLTRAGIRVLYE